MLTVLTEWLSIIFRWLHVTAAMAWIGSSFYFIHLDYTLKPGANMPARADGEAWQVHGGGFYQIVKYLVAPTRMPDELTWFKWEAYTTWLSGFALMVVVYYLGADLFLIDRSVLDISPSTGAVIAFVSLALLWLAYEGACRSPLGKHEVMLALIGYVFLVGLTYGFTHIFSGRGALNQIGALIGTIMVANVFLVIIPNQKNVIVDLIAGRAPDPGLGEQGKQRSVHNNYLTLPVIFLMLSNHYPLIYATQYNWVIVAIVLAIGPVIRHFFNSRHQGKGNPWWTWAVAGAGVAVIAWLSAGAPLMKVGSLPPPPKFAQVAQIVISHCSVCHASNPVWPGIDVAPDGVLLDQPDRIMARARLIDLNAVQSHAMPPGNVTGMTEAERRSLAAWFAAGKPM